MWEKKRWPQDGALRWLPGRISYLVYGYTICDNAHRIVEMSQALRYVTQFITVIRDFLNHEPYDHN